MDLKENNGKKEIKDEGCPKPIIIENPKEKNISKINKIINDNKSEEKVFDLLFLIDATGSMSSYITAAKDETENISKELRTSYPEYHFQYGYIFYRDPIDSPRDIHEIINLTDNVNSLPEKIKKIKADGGGDLPEDWVGAYKLANEKINWRNGLKVIIHLADAGAHGKEFTLSDKYPQESAKLKKELLNCSKNKIKIFGYVITEDARNSFIKSQNYYRSNGGSYEICEFKIDSNSYSDDADDDESVKRPKFKKSRKKCIEKYKLKMGEDIKGKEFRKYKTEKYNEYLCRKRDRRYESPKQKKINSEFREKVLKSVKYAFHEK